MGLFGRKKQPVQEVLPPPQVDDGIWRRTLKQTDIRATIKRTKLEEAVTTARREAATLIASDRPSLAAHRVSAALATGRGIAALDAVKRAATALLALLPNLSGAPAALTDLTPAAETHICTLLAAGDPPPLVPEASHLAGQINAFFSASAVAAFRATIEPDPAVVTARSSQLPHTPQQVSEGMQSVAHEYNVTLRASTESVPPALAKASHAVVSSRPTSGYASASWDPVSHQPRIVRVDGTPPTDLRDGAPASQTPLVAHSVASNLYESGGALDPRSTPPHLRETEPTTPILAGTSRPGLVHIQQANAPRLGRTVWPAPSDPQANIRSGSSGNQTSTPDDVHVARQDTDPQRYRLARSEQGGSQLGSVFVDDDDMLLIRYNELMSV